jgi:hypothetical protein
MLTPKQVTQQINARIGRLVEIGLSDHQAFAFMRRSGRNVSVVFDSARSASSLSMKNMAYGEMYRCLVEEQAYNVKMLDGALVQMLYEFFGSTLLRHRLAFFPAPHLDEFQNDPDIYLEDQTYGDVVARDVVPFPLRFDYDARDGRYRELLHPKSHLTLGQYERCRIPVSAPITPHWFVDFILRNFYHTAARHYADEMPPVGDVFDQTISPLERRVVHVAIPC